MSFQGVHHIAIATRDPEALASFYEALGLTRSKEHREGDGRVRSVWMELGKGSVLMLERADHDDATAPSEFATKRPGLHLLALTIVPKQRAALVERLQRQAIRIEHETVYTVYVRDPEGNRIGFSHYPAQV